MSDRQRLNVSGAGSLESADAVARLIAAAEAAERGAHRDEARRLYEEALHQLSGGDAGVEAAMLLRRIAATYMMDASSDDALDCAEAALAVSTACGDRGGEGHAINVKAAVHWTLGDLDTAEVYFREARAKALSVDDRALVAMTSANLGMIASVRGDYPDALHHLGVGLANYRELGRLRDVCHALNNMGLVYTDMERWTEAERAYTEAVVVARESDDVSTRIILEVNRAKMWLARGDAPRATAAVDEATMLSQEAGDTAWLAEVAKLRGALLRDAGSPVEAEQQLTAAVTMAEARHETLLLAESLRERAELYRGQGRNREALQNLNRAHRLFEQLRAKRELANIGRSFTRLEDDFVNVVKRWGESIEAKDHYTQGHCVRVADLSCAIAALCGFEGQTLFWFRIGALLHDVGKLVVPSEILNKSGKLDAEEWQLMRSHPSAGVDMLAGIDFPWDVRPIIESHHERWDGKGYPHGLAGEDIPLSARILAVADVYDALTSVRSYKPAFSHDEAFAIMHRDVGQMFDPAVFAQFERVMREGRFPVGQSSIGAMERSELVPRAPAAPVAIEDAVTGLPGRDSIERIGAQVLSDWRATHDAVSLIALELDAAPSASSPSAAARERAILRAVARQLRRETRATDFVARTAPLQFMALLPGSSVANAEAVAARIRSSLEDALRQRPNTASGALPLRTAVVGVTNDRETFGDLAARAERAVKTPAVNPRSRSAVRAS